jgi:hypothetical protein
MGETMRYKDSGNVHKDFHLATNRTVNYVLDTYGDEFLHALFKRTAQGVYQSIWNDLKKGDSSQLLEHWRHYYDREGGEYRVEETGDDELRFYVDDCPAIRHLKENGVEVTGRSYLPTVLLNKYWSDGTAFNIETEILGDGRYVQTIVRKSGNGYVTE